MAGNLNDDPAGGLSILTALILIALVLALSWITPGLPELDNAGAGGGAEMMEDDAYVALCPICRGWQAIRVICPHTNKDMGKYLGQWHRRGLIIERWPIERVRQEAVSCKCLKK